MVEFCPECGNMLRKKTCRCGYGELDATSKDASHNHLIKIWNPPSPNAIYCKITATPHEKLKSMLNKGMIPEKLKEVREKFKNHLYSCRNCVYYYEEISHCKFKNKYLSKDSICKSYEPYDIIG
ncbi:MAG: hypothetical protein CEE43_07885 [Promethearchaeota archaeon Loki_b32]|nr:MAG: hypothetical protein CEE43_07885 [Candidatus Lokiarchaeota archaeon Loki_b32]